MNTTFEVEERYLKKGIALSREAIRVERARKPYTRTTKQHYKLDNAIRLHLNKHRSVPFKTSAIAQPQVIN